MIRFGKEGNRLKIRAKSKKTKIFESQNEVNKLKGTLFCPDRKDCGCTQPWTAKATGDLSLQKGKHNQL